MFNKIPTFSTDRDGRLPLQIIAWKVQGILREVAGFVGIDG